MRSPDWRVSVFDTNLPRILRVYMPESRKMTEQIDWRAKRPSHYVSEDLKCWGTWDITCGHKAKNVTPPTAWARGVATGSCRRSPLKGRKGAIVNQANNGTVSKTILGILLRLWVKSISADRQTDRRTHARTHAGKHAQTHTRTHARAHTHTQSNSKCLQLPLPQFADFCLYTVPLPLKQKS